MAKNSDHNDDLIKQGKDKFKEKFDNAEETNVVDFLKMLEAKDPEISILKELNDKHVFINSFGGKPRITNKVYNEVTKREELEFISIESFCQIYSNKIIPGYKIPVQRGKWWANNEHRKTADGVIFDPLAPPGLIDVDNNKYLNLWEGFGVVPKKGKWKETKKHIYKILSNSSAEKFKYIIKWLAWAVQNPHIQAEVCLVFKGEKGTGKSFLFEQFKKIFAKHGMIISDPNRLTGKFTGHFRSLCFLFCDEAYYSGDKKVEGRIKSLITSSVLDTEQKNYDAVTVVNRLHIVMATNNEWVIPATQDERRYFIEEVNNKYAQGRASNTTRKTYFTKIWNEMDTGGREAMLFDLLNYDLKGWHPRNSIPQTVELQKQKELSLSYIEQAVKQILEDGLFPGEYNKLTYKISSDAFCSYLDKLEPLCVKFSSVKKTKLIKELGCIKGRIPGIGRVQWEFPELNIIRKNWDKLHGKAQWDSETKWTIQKSEF